MATIKKKSKTCKNIPLTIESNIHPITYKYTILVRK